MSNPDDFVIENGVLKEYQGAGGDVVIPEGVTSIGRSAFAECKKMKSVTIPDSVTSIGDYAFEKCAGLTSVILGNSIVSIGWGAFSRCAKLKCVTIPDSVTSIGSSSFSSCRKLKCVTIPESVTSIGDYPFYDCSELTEITVDENNPNYSSDSFGVLYNKNKTKLIQYPIGNTSESFIIPDGVSKIGKHAFYFCENLKSVTIPSSVTGIGNDGFFLCNGLTRVNISDLAAWCAIKFGSRANPLHNANELYVNNALVTDIVIPDGVPSIKDYAFDGFRGVESVTIPDSVKKIGEGAFQGCDNLSTIANLPLDVNLSEKTFHWSSSFPKNLQGDFPFLAAAFFSQTSKKLMKECEAFLCEDPAAAAQAMIDVLNGKGKDKHYIKAAEFFLGHRKETGGDLLKALYEQAVADKAQKAAETLKPQVEEDAQPAPADGREIETFCRKNFAEQLLDKTIQEQEINAQLFDTVKYKDNGDPAPAFVVKCAVIPYIDQLKENPKHISNYKWDYCKFTLCKEADRAAAELEESSFLAVLTKLARISLEGSRYDCSHAYWSPAMLLPLCRYASGALVNDLASTMRREWVSWDQYGAKGRTAIIITRGALLLNDSREAMLFAEKEKCLDYYAQIRDTDADVLRSTRMIDFGFNADGKILYDLGSTVIEATLGDDLAISLYDTAAGKAVKSLPKRGAEEAKYNECAAAFAEFKKNYKKIVKARNDLLFESFLNGRAVKAKIWQEAYLGNPVLNKVARLIVWSQSGKTFTLGRDGLIDSTGAAFTLQKNIDVAVAHPIEMQVDDVARWQRYFTGKQLKQPFEQIWEPSLVKNGVDKDRYKGICIPYYRFLHQEKHGITVYDKNYHNDITIYLADCNARVKRVDWARHEISPDDRFEVASIVPKSQSRAANHILYYLDKCTIYGMLERDEVESLPDLNGYTAAQLSAFLSFSIEHNAVKCTAALLDYKNEHFADFSAMDEFTLDL